MHIILMIFSSGAEYIKALRKGIYDAGNLFVDKNGVDIISRLIIFL